MKAAFCHRYGPPDVVTLENIPIPRPAPGEILVRVHASTVSSADHRLRGLDMPRGFGLMGRLIFGINGPRRPILGAELAGEVAALGPGVTGFHKGERIFAFTGARGGGHAEYATLPVTSAIARTPDCLTGPEAAAMSFGGATALHFLRDKAGLQAGERLLVIGAGGAVGSAGVQLGRAFGAQVTGLCSPGKSQTVRDLGAVQVLASGDDPPMGTMWDVIMDTVGIVTLDQARVWLAPGGRFAALAADLPQMIAGAMQRLGQGRRVLTGPAPERAQDLADLADLARAGHYRPLIGATFAFGDIVQAHALTASGHKLGSTVVTMV